MPSVAVITRTKNRDILLKRALKSVLCQSHKEIEWIIVNDGGEAGPVDDIAESALGKGVNVVVIHNSESLGMEAASNLGIRRAKSGYVVIHDDDDSWHRLFLEKTLGFLESERGAKYGGVITHSVRVEEVMGGDNCKEWSRTSFNGHLKSIYLFGMARVCQFPPISFVYRRELYDDLGGYDESLPVLGDWDFNLRFLLRSDIGLICEPLAYYHIRISTNEGEYGNTVTQGVDKHIEYDAIIRNKLLREEVNDGLSGLGCLVNYARELKSESAAQLLYRFMCNLYWGSIVGKYFRRLFFRKSYK